MWPEIEIEDFPNRCQPWSELLQLLQMEFKTESWLRFFHLARHNCIHETPPSYLSSYWSFPGWLNLPGLK
ncbi:hypothetical protein LINPERHAP2_LOCUS21024 [Linum perenne]